jgi:GxxExxY protein
MKELALQGLAFRNQVWVTLQYKAMELDTELRLDVLVEEILCVKLKVQEGLLPVHDAILLSYRQMSEKPKGILIRRMLCINFHCTNIFKGG